MRQVKYGTYTSSEPTQADTATSTSTSMTNTTNNNQTNETNNNNSNNNNNNNNNNNISIEILNIWKDLKEMNCNEAKRMFLIDIYNIAPYWKYEQFI